MAPTPENPETKRTTSHVELTQATTEQLQAIKDDIVRRLAERSKGIPRPEMMASHDSVYHSKS